MALYPDYAPKKKKFRLFDAPEQAAQNILSRRLRGE